MKGRFLKLFTLLICGSLFVGCVACGGRDNDSFSSITTSSFENSSSEEFSCIEKSDEVVSEILSEESSSEEISSEESSSEGSLSEESSSEGSLSEESSSEESFDKNYTEGLEFTLLEDGTYSVTDYIGTATEVVIPSDYKGKAVTAIGLCAFYGRGDLVAITIPDGVTSIGEAVFDKCHSLKEIILPKGLTCIKSGVFFGCSSLTAVAIPEGVISIEDHAFYNCTNLTKIVIPEGVTSIGSDAFYNCTSLAEIVMPKSMTSIGSDAFWKCRSLTGIFLSDRVSEIGEDAFLSCDSLTIYCQVAKQLDTWDPHWNFSNLPVVWSCENNDVADDGYVYAIIGGVRYGFKNGEATVVRQPYMIATVNIAETLTYKNTAYRVTMIAPSAFSLCPYLANIAFEGTAAQWNEITVEMDAFSWYVCPATEVVCSDAKVVLQKPDVEVHK